MVYSSPCGVWWARGSHHPLKAKPMLITLGHREWLSTGAGCRLAGSRHFPSGSRWPQRCTRPTREATLTGDSSTRSYWTAYGARITELRTSKGSLVGRSSTAGATEGPPALTQDPAVVCLKDQSTPEFIAVNGGGGGKERRGRVLTCVVGTVIPSMLACRTGSHYLTQSCFFGRSPFAKSFKASDVRYLPF